MGTRSVLQWGQLFREGGLECWGSKSPKVLGLRQLQAALWCLVQISTHSTDQAASPKPGIERVDFYCGGFLTGKSMVDDIQQSQVTFISPMVGSSPLFPVVFPLTPSPADHSSDRFWWFWFDYCDKELHVYVIDYLTRRFSPGICI